MHALLLAVALQVAAPTTEESSGTRGAPPTLVALVEVAVSQGAAVAGASIGVAAALLVPLAATGACLGFGLFRETDGFQQAPSTGVLVDAALYGSLFFSGALPLVLVGALAGDALGYAVTVPMWRRRADLRTALPVLITLAVALPAMVLGAASGAVFTVWLLASPLPDVFMVVGLAGMAVALGLAWVGAGVVRPVVHATLLLAVFPRRPDAPASDE